MATYSRVSKDIPSNDRSMLITDVAVGDKINFTEILGRPAKLVQVYTEDDTAVVEYRLNNRRVFKIKRPDRPYLGWPGTRLLAHEGVSSDYFSTEVVWASHGGFPVFSNEGECFEIAGGINVASMEIAGLTNVATVSIVIR